MRIESAQIATAARHSAREQITQEQSLEYWRDERRPAEPSPQPPTDRLSLSDAAYEAQCGGEPIEVEKRANADEGLSPRDRLIADILRRLFKVLTGKDMRLASPEELARRAKEAHTAADGAARLDKAPASTPAPQGASVGFGLIYNERQSYYEAESMAFSAQGSIKTRDGQEIQFSVELHLNREFYTEHGESLRLGDARKVDPLVLNYDGDAAQLTDSKFLFDLDADGNVEPLSQLKAGSGLLALDRNGDGQINDGKELFGALTGNGFADLAAYDEDGNGFIDEADSAFGRLRVWTPEQQGAQQLTSLANMGISAIYLGQTATPYTFKDSANRTQGAVASTGLFIRENGKVGTVQQVDYAV